MYDDDDDDDDDGSIQKYTFHWIPSISSITLETTKRGRQEMEIDPIRRKWRLVGK